MQQMQNQYSGYQNVNNQQGYQQQNNNGYQQQNNNGYQQQNYRYTDER